MLTFVIHRLQALLALDVPQPDCFVMRAGQQQAAIRGDRQTRHLVPGMGKRKFQRRVTRGLPETGAVGRRGRWSVWQVRLVPHLCPLKIFPFSRSVWKVRSLWTGCRNEGRKGESSLNSGRPKPADSSLCLKGAEEIQGNPGPPNPWQVT